MKDKEISVRSRLADGGKTAKKTAGKTAGRRSAPSPLTGATLPLGAHPGNTGGKKGRSGRLPSIVRDFAREAFADRLDILTQIADGKAIQRMKIGDVETETFISADVSDRLRALDLLAKYGLGTIKEVSVEDVRERVQRTLDVIQERTSPEQFVSIVQQLQPIWA